MNCSASSLPPGSVRSVMGTVAAELVSSLRGAAAACNVTPIVVGDGLRAAGCLNGRGRCGKQTRGRFNYAGRRLRGPGTATEPEIVESGPSLT
jgi:hypothetical protein